MVPNIYCISAGLIVVGTTFLVFGVLVKLGRYKRWYLYEGDPALSPKEFAYVCAPFGLAIIVMGTALVLPTHEVKQMVFLCLDLPLIIVASLLLFWLPEWIKPAWVRWLEKNHGDILLLLLRQARRTPDWEQRVATQEGLEAWVAEVRHKYTLENR
jgi:hypothetical protein